MEPTTIHRSDRGADGSADRPRPFRRADEGRMLGGVCAGIADCFDVDVVLVRIAVAVLALAGGVGVPLYLAAWLLVPEEGTDESIAERLLHDVRGPNHWTPHVHAGQGGDGGNAQAS